MGFQGRLGAIPLQPPDWWVFPVNRRSSAGLTWTVSEGEATTAKSGHEGGPSFSIAFLNVFAQSLLAVLGGLVILDWLIVRKLTPRFVVIPGTTAADHKDVSHHLRAVPALLVLCLVIALIVWYFLGRRASSQQAYGADGGRFG